MKRMFLFSTTSGRPIREATPEEVKRSKQSEEEGANGFINTTLSSHCPDRISAFVEDLKTQLKRNTKALPPLHAEFGKIT